MYLFSRLWSVVCMSAAWPSGFQLAFFSFCPVPGSPPDLDNYVLALAVGVGWGCLNIFCSHLSFVFSPSF